MTFCGGLQMQWDAMMGWDVGGGSGKYHAHIQLQLLYVAKEDGEWGRRKKVN